LGVSQEFSCQSQLSALKQSQEPASNFELRGGGGTAIKYFEFLPSASLR